MWPADLSRAGLEQFQSSIVNNRPKTWKDVGEGQYVDLPCLHSRGYTTKAKPRLHYLVWDRTEPGAPPPPAVLLQHGIMDWGWLWNVIGPVLAERFKTLVVAPDLPGRGRSAFAEDGSVLVEARPVTQHHGSDDYLRVLDEFVQRVVPADRSLWVVGHSMGGALAFLFTARFPERVEKLALLSPAGHMSSMAALRCLLKRDCIRGCVHKVMSGDLNVKDDFWDLKHPAAEYMLAHMTLQQLTNADHFLDPLLGSAMQFPLYGLEPRVEQFASRDGWKKPLLLMCARQDKIVPFATMASWARCLSAGSSGGKPDWLTEHVVDEAGHCFYWEKHGESIQVLIEFLGT